MMSSELFSWCCKIIFVSCTVFYLAFSILLVKKDNFIRRSLINDTGKLLRFLCLLNLVLAIIMLIASIIIRP